MFLLLFLIISNSFFYLLVSGLARMISLVLAHILHSAENHSWTLIVLFLKLKRHFLKRPSFEKRKTLSILCHSDSLWRSCKRSGHPTTKCFQICHKSLKCFFLCFKPAVWLIWSYRKLWPSRKLQLAFSFHQRLLTTLLGTVKSSRSGNSNTFKRKSQEAFCLSLYTEIFRRPIFNNNRSISVIKCEERNFGKS